MDPRLIAADAAIQQGRRADAIDIMISALLDGIEQSENLYRALLRNLLALARYEDGVIWATKAVNFAPKSYELLNLLGIFLRRTGRYREALDVLDDAIRLKPADNAALVNKGNVHNDLEEGPAAEAIFTKLLRKTPKSPEFQRSLARALSVQKKFGPAMMRLRQAIALKRDDINAWLDLAALIDTQGDHATALATIDKALKVLPDDPRLLQAKVTSIRLSGKVRAAEAYLQSLSDKFGDTAWFHYQMARSLPDSERERANSHYRKAAELAPDDFEYRMSLAESLERTRGPGEGAHIDEGYAVLCATNMPARFGGGETKIAAEIFTRVADYDAIAKLGNFAEMGRLWVKSGRHTALLGQMPRVRTDEDRRELLEQHRMWGQQALDVAQRMPITRPAAKAKDKIRVGFMSSDLRDHPVAYFSLPLFENVDRDRFEIYCYSFFVGTEASPIQRRLTEMVDAFRWHPDITERDAAQMIANDQLDILFELGGATHMNKVGVMAWKPAPITVSWLGYPHSIGLETIDYLLVDPFLNPPDSSLLIEKPLVMPKSWIAMSRYAFPDVHQINPIAPVKRNGFITFGTANNPYKYSPEMLRVWAKTMAGVPNSRFLFVRPEGGSKAFVGNIRAYFNAAGIAADRIEFRAVRGAHMPHYNDIDIALDTFPQTGGTTTCEAAWMGVPTISLVGPALFERLSYSILHNAGLGDLCASTQENYIEIAARLAADPDRIQTLRTELREQLRAGPLGQTETFARDFYDLVARTVAERASA
ncbi:tetratricopeptide repeat protein [Rhizorhabdus dicambivorans]|uniref:protein O-GlcNAc transferase n=1 Tax=Rhizorhabdus dicambivorans TaxID=1850238 RepID=A0A2A4FN99_9SPHN|nr:tetratricopeptide repeat protein [Rhizorhabdus dicambivorans]ATE64042.1 hypothetical protein CMV14_06245 [Rhizorhabdus dicambivorans]PCE40235.1 hypothetical protein COO09_21415 [Rhizorhabdus dicambivorans]